jgi:hypothetical protein
VARRPGLSIFLVGTTQLTVVVRQRAATIAFVPAQTNSRGEPVSGDNLGPLVL